MKFIKVKGVDITASVYMDEAFYVTYAINPNEIISISAKRTHMKDTGRKIVYVEIETRKRTYYVAIPNKEDEVLLAASLKACGICDLYDIMRESEMPYDHIRLLERKSR